MVDDIAQRDKDEHVAVVRSNLRKTKVELDMYRAALGVALGYLDTLVDHSMAARQVVRKVERMLSRVNRAR